MTELLVTEVLKTRKKSSKATHLIHKLAGTYLCRTSSHALSLTHTSICTNPCTPETYSTSKAWFFEASASETIKGSDSGFSRP